MALYANQLLSEATERSTDMDVGVDAGLARALYSELDIQNEKFNVDRAYRRYDVVRQWFEETYYEHVRYVEQTAAWLGTRAALEGSSLGATSISPLVVELDPDAPIREAKEIEGEDKAVYDGMFRSVFALLRAGRWDEAKDLCSTLSSHPWLAAILHGRNLSHDPTMFSESEAAFYEAGNPRRNLWRAMLLKLISVPSVTLHERAIYAVLCGQLDPLLDVSEDWETMCWAYLSVSETSMLQQELTRQRDPYFEDIDPALQHQVFSMEEIFHSAPRQLASRNRGRTTRDSILERYRTIQQLLIEGRFEHLMELMAQWLMPTFRVSSEIRWLARFGVHLMLTLQAMAIPLPDVLMQAVLLSYINHLMRTHQTSLVALYANLPLLATSQRILLFGKYIHDLLTTPSNLDTTSPPLPERSLLDAYSEVTPDVGLAASPGPSQTSAAAAAAVEVAQAVFPSEYADMLDYAASLTEQTETLSSAQTLEPYSAHSERSTFLDNCKILAVQLFLPYIYERGMTLRTLLHFNLLARRFIEEEKFLLTCKLIQGVEVPEPSASEYDTDEESTIIKIALREYDCWREFVFSQTEYETWNAHQSIHLEPPLPVPADAGVADKLIFDQEQEAYESEREQWISEGAQLAERAATALSAVLKTPGGWLEGCSARNPHELEQLKYLRKVCIPRVAMQLHSVLYSSERFRACIELAELIADEHFSLFKCFDLEDMEEYLQLVAKCAVVCMC